MRSNVHAGFSCMGIIEICFGMSRVNCSPSGFPLYRRREVVRLVDLFHFDTPHEIAVVTGACKMRNGKQNNSAPCPGRNCAKQTSKNRRWRLQTAKTSLLDPMTSVHACFLYVSRKLPALLRKYLGPVSIARNLSWGSRATGLKTDSERTFPCLHRSIEYREWSAVRSSFYAERRHLSIAYA